MIKRGKIGRYSQRVSIGTLLTPQSHYTKILVAAAGTILHPTFLTFFWPSLQHLAAACLSTAGFQSGSNYRLKQFAERATSREINASKNAPVKKRPRIAITHQHQPVCSDKIQPATSCFAREQKGDQARAWVVKLNEQ